MPPLPDCPSSGGMSAELLRVALCMEMLCRLRDSIPFGVSGWRVGESRSSCPARCPPEPCRRMGLGVADAANARLLCSKICRRLAMYQDLYASSRCRRLVSTTIGFRAGSGELLPLGELKSVMSLALRMTRRSDTDPMEPSESTSVASDHPLSLGSGWPKSRLRATPTPAALSLASVDCSLASPLFAVLGSWSSALDR